MNYKSRRCYARVHPRGAVLTRLFLVLGLLLGLSFGASAQEKAMLQSSFANNAQSIKIDVLVGQSRLIEFDQEYERLSISDPKVAEVVPITPRQALVNGLNFGQVNLVAWAKLPKGSPDRMLVFDIYVQVNLSLIDNQIKILFPKENIQLSQANSSVVISGSVTKPEISEQAQKIIEAAGLKVTNLLKSPVLDAAQVQLQIRVAEVNRSVLRELALAYGIANDTIPAFISSNGPASLNSAQLSYGANPASKLDFTLGSALNIFLGNPNSSAATLGFIRALNTRGALRDLAEPNLIAMHGQPASFLAGGEFPIPVIQSLSAGQSAITVIFKEFGVKLDFKPTIIDENHIRLELAPEVSSLDFTAGVQVSGLIVPGLRVRRAKTTLELRDGQSFALAGLIDNSERVNLSKVPLLGDIPILGELFKSRSFQRNETELLFLATVKIVEPLNPDQIPRLPGVSELKPVGSTNPGGATPAGSIEGQSGHSIPRKPGDGAMENENKNPGGQSNGGKADRGTTSNLTSSVIGPVGPEINPKKPEIPAVPKPEVKEQKPTPQGSDKP